MPPTVRITYSEFVKTINALKNEPVATARENIDIEILNGTEKKAYSRDGKAILVPTARCRDTSQEYDVDESAIKPGFVINKMRALLSAYLVANTQLRPKDDPWFVGGDKVVVATLPEIKTVILAPRYTTYTHEPVLPIFHYACLMFTNNYSHGIVLVHGAFPKCAHLHLVGKKCFVLYYESILDALDEAQERGAARGRADLFLSAPRLPFAVERGKLLGEVGQGVVFDVDDDRVIKIIEIGFPHTIRQEYDLRRLERFALNEALIMFYLQSKNFPHSPRALSFGHFNGIYFYIEMSKVKGSPPGSDKDYALCKESVGELHKMGILHNNLHAGNLLMRENKTGCILLDYSFSGPMSEYLPDSEFLHDEIQRASGGKRRRSNY